MKKLISTISAMALICTAACAVAAHAEGEEKTTVNVTIAEPEGKLALVQESVEVTDVDGDGSVTISDALYLAHEAQFEGGAAAGYKASVGQWGLGLDKLWGIENGGSYGIYVNNAATLIGIGDTVADGDNIYAFAYTDLQKWSDQYSYFDITSDKKDPGESIDLTLSKVSWGADGGTVISPVEGAVITINGEDTEFKTDAEGKVTVALANEGENLISAKSDSEIITPPFALVQVGDVQEPTTEPATEAPTEPETEAPTEEAATTAAATTTKAAAKTTAASKSDNASPKTGDAGTGAAVAVIGVSVCAAFALRKRNEK
ncbi:MAG: NPXTG-anchored protein [Ruminococcus sp.]|nr:NPXTG-anchored protein [Ruminococcus sp.]